MTATGPFIVTQHGICEDCSGNGGVLRWEDGRVVGSQTCGTCVDGDVVVYREAFATQEDRDRVSCVLILNAVPIDAQPDLYAQVTALGESGGQIALPNGDVIAVEATTYGTLAQQANYTADDPIADNETAILAAWNAEHGIGIGART
jgi:hypothetical protein